MQADISQLPLKKWLVTRTEQAVVRARTEDHALFLGEEMIAYWGADTCDTQVEELED